MKQRVCIVGISGKVGRVLAQKLTEDQRFELVCGVSRRPLETKNLLMGAGVDVPIVDKVEDILPYCPNVAIDFTSAVVVKEHVLKIIGMGVNVVVGSSGIDDSDYEFIHLEALRKNVGVFAAGNFSLTAALLQKFAVEAATIIPNFEVLDYGSHQKPDSPSGTARELLHHISKVTPQPLDVPPKASCGDAKARGATLHGIQAHSIRLPAFHSAIEIIFALDGERITIAHESISNTPYVQGVILATKRVATFKGLRRGILESGLAER